MAAYFTLETKPSRLTVRPVWTRAATALTCEGCFARGSGWLIRRINTKNPDQAFLG